MSPVIQAQQGDQIENIESALIQARDISKPRLVAGSAKHRAVQVKAKGRVIVTVERAFFKP